MAKMLIVMTVTAKELIKFINDERTNKTMDLHFDSDNYYRCGWVEFEVGVIPEKV